MSKPYDRRQVLKGVAAASASLLLPKQRPVDGIGSALAVAGQNVHVDSVKAPEVEIQVVSISAHTLRFTVLPIRNGQVEAIPPNGSLVRKSWGEPILKLRGETQARTVKSGNLRVNVSAAPLSFGVETESGEIAQNLVVDVGVVYFKTGSSPLLGLGEGGPQFDRRGSMDAMRSGQGGYQLATHGGRVPIPWLIGTAGWAIYIHHPFGSFDFTGPQSKFTPGSASATLPLDIFLIGSRDPAIIMSEYALLTGHAAMPPRWSLGYQQSHRTLGGREEILSEA